MPDWTVHHGDCLDVMRTMDAASVDAIVTDPPYGLSFMGKHWDHGIPGVDFWVEAMRVAKPGAHLLAFGGTRTFHRLAVAIEDAGWEVRDTLMWLYGQGFPKSLDVSKAIDKAAGADREVVQTIPDRWAGAGQVLQRATQTNRAEAHITAPTTDAALQWSGWGTALKPAWEPIIMARKPLVGTVAANVQTHGTGAINVDGCRIASDGSHMVHGVIRRKSGVSGDMRNKGKGSGAFSEDAAFVATNSPLGRWPANVVMDEAAGEMLDAQSPHPFSSGAPGGGWWNTHDLVGTVTMAHSGFGDRGGASRFFYCPKASRDDRNEGCEWLPEGENALKYQDGDGFCGRTQLPDGTWVNTDKANRRKPRNTHATVKPTELMRWLVRLVTRPGGVVLDPFTGSGTTGVACAREGVRFIGIEKEAEYATIARARIAEANNHLFGSQPCH